MEEQKEIQILKDLNKKLMNDYYEKEKECYKLGLFIDDVLCKYNLTLAHTKNIIRRANLDNDNLNIIDDTSDEIKLSELKSSIKSIKFVSESYEQLKRLYNK